MPLAAIAAIGVAGSIAGGAIAAHGAGQAANAQVGAANHAADLQHQDTQAALAYQKEKDALAQQNAAPWLHAGQEALGQLSGYLSPGGALTQGFNEQFQAPTSITEQNDPGYQFRLQQGQKALQNSAAAKGGLLSGNTAKAFEDYTQQSASNEYGNVYNRAMQEYMNRYNVFENNQTNLYNRLAGISGLGQTSANQLNAQGQQSANNVSNILLTSGQQIGNDYQNAGAARASGYVGAGNAYAGALGGASNNIMDLLLLRQLSGGGSSDPYGLASGNYPS